MEPPSAELDVGLLSPAAKTGDGWTILGVIPVPVVMVSPSGFPFRWNPAFRGLFQELSPYLDERPATPDRWHLSRAHSRMSFLLAAGGAREVIDLGPMILELDVAVLAGEGALVVARDVTAQFNQRAFDEVVGAQMRQTSNRVTAMVRDLAAEFPRIDANAASTARATDVVRAASEELVENLTRLVERTAAVTSALDAATRDTKSVSAEADREAEQTIDGLHALETETRQMANWAAVIGDIAHQTHILALNISVGAARVGTAGAEFAIIAREVRELAGRTREISSSIEASSKAVVARLPEALTSLSALRGHISRNRCAIDAIAAVAAEQRAEVRRIELHAPSRQGERAGLAELLHEVATKSNATLEIVRSSSALLSQMKTLLRDIDFVVERSESEPRTTPSDVFRMIRVIYHLLVELYGSRDLEPRACEAKRPFDVLLRLADVGAAISRRTGIDVDLAPPRATVSPTQVFIRAHRLVGALKAYFERGGRPLPLEAQTEPPYRDKTPSDVYAQVDLIARELVAP